MPGQREEGGWCHSAALSRASPQGVRGRRAKCLHCPAPCQRGKLNSPSRSVFSEVSLGAFPPEKQNRCFALGRLAGSLLSKLSRCDCTRTGRQSEPFSSLRRAPLKPISSSSVRAAARARDWAGGKQAAPRPWPLAIRQPPRAHSPGTPRHPFSSRGAYAAPQHALASLQACSGKGNT